MVPVVPVRGSARPNVCFVLERLADRIAHELKLDPAEVRRRSFIAKEQFPYDTGLKGRDPGSSTVYDSGDYHACLEQALVPFADFKQRQAAARSKGRYIGFGLASYVEDTGRPFEGATVAVARSGRITVTTGAGAQGQGLQTILAQITADALGVTLDAIDVVTADTDRFKEGQGTVGSRTAVTAGSSTHVAAIELKEKLLRAAAGLLSSGNRFLEIRDGRIAIADEPSTSITVADVAQRLGDSDLAALTATGEHNAGAQPFSFGTNACEVDVDIDTGEVRIVRYVVAHDCGRLIHPGMVDGQIRGGVVHGIGNALFERMSYDESGNPVTTNYGEYLLPMAMEMPRIEIHHLETLSPLNPLGIKGAGEGGTIPAAACIIAAVENALEPFGVHLTQHPISPQRVLEMIGAPRRTAA
jgi:carbon-monoxide dehydrogenase large subunit